VFRAIAAACRALVGLAHGVSGVIHYPCGKTQNWCWSIFPGTYLSAVHHEAPSASAQLEALDIYLPPHGFDTIWLQLITCAVPWCGDPRAKLSYRRCGVDPSKPNADEKLRARPQGRRRCQWERPEDLVHTRSVATSDSPVISRYYCTVVMSKYRRPRQTPYFPCQR
jgi:hypothetical protein